MNNPIYVHQDHLAEVLTKLDDGDSFTASRLGWPFHNHYIVSGPILNAEDWWEFDETPCGWTTWTTSLGSLMADMPEDLAMEALTRGKK